VTQESYVSGDRSAPSDRGDDRLLPRPHRAERDGAPTRVWWSPIKRVRWTLPRSSRPIPTAFAAGPAAPGASKPGERVGDLVSQLRGMDGRPVSRRRKAGLVLVNINPGLFESANSSHVLGAQSNGRAPHHGERASSRATTSRMLNAASCPSWSEDAKRTETVPSCRPCGTSITIGSGITRPAARPSMAVSNSGPTRNPCNLLGEIGATIDPRSAVNIPIHERGRTGLPKGATLLALQTSSTNGYFVGRGHGHPARLARVAYPVSACITASAWSWATWAA